MTQELDELELALINSFRHLRKKDCSSIQTPTPNGDIITGSLDVDFLLMEDRIYLKARIKWPRKV